MLPPASLTIHRSDSREPFVSGIPEMIDVMVANIPDAEKEFRLLFSSAPFPGYQVKLEKVRAEYEGTQTLVHSFVTWEGLSKCEVR